MEDRTADCQLDGTSRRRLAVLAQSMHEVTPPKISKRELDDELMAYPGGEPWNFVANPLQASV